MKVKYSVATLLVLFSLLCLVRGWGGMFNRFNPSMLSNLGYGSSYGSKLYSAANTEDNTYKQRRYQPRQDVEEAINEIIAEEEEEDPCEGKKCTANEHCCDGHVCVDMEDEMNRASYGTCMPIFGHKLGEECKQDHDCETGYLCRADGGAKSCQLPVSGSQELGEDCNTSSDCDISRGLCCKLQRRARSQPKKLCAYFSDPLMCIGKVSSNLIRSSIEHTGGEKRRSSHPDYRHLRR